ncbi:sulfite exporter TauE/SafE family protein [Brevibacterium gallinarum]|uniref:Probable membrane transporter protein n=1 Tax=Brevibacterium gallinarum TaxID=2762220 RepID=A0ABR8WVL1_9MICO|nr:sulfite exporter TauE/SafE family protein [Brevibacterium gallinarum]MBD8020771.1 sulfite exporter TauE/SafE family protein [Brevibacterium gallinarum]
MELHHILLTLLAGVGAGGINAIVGSGTLITFPALVAFGVPPVTATMSNAVGLIPGNIASSFGYRTELAGQKKRMLQLIPASLLGALTGAYLLLHLPEDAFITIVPVLLVLALLLVIFQPMLQRLLRDRAMRSAEEAAPASAAGPAGPPSMSIGRHITVFIVVYATAVYGGYFAAAQGIILIALLGMLLPETLQRINGAKNVLVLVVNTVAASIYVIVGFDRINWMAAGLIAAGSLIGGYLGARVGRKFSPVLLRSVIVVLGLVALWNILQM